MPINYNVIDCIYENINSKINNRYLLLFGNNDENEKILKNILINKNYVILSDTNLEEYDNESNGILYLLLKIQKLMEQEIVLILKNLEVLYPSLYDLFNKNFTQYGNNKKFAKISYENKQTLLFVNDNFRIIILVDNEKRDTEDKAFLNRFEKHILSIDNLLGDKAVKIANDCYESINNLIKIKDNNKINLENHLININLQKIKFCIYKIIKEMNKENDFSFENLIDKLLSNIVPLFSQEMISLLNYNDFKIEGVSYKSKIKKIYQEKYKKCFNFKSYLVTFVKNSFQNIIYTFSRKGTNLFIDENDKKNFHLKIFDLKNNFEIDDFQQYIKNEQYNLIIFKIKEKEIQGNDLLVEIKAIIDDYINNKNKDKIFIFIIYMKKSNEDNEDIKDDNYINDIKDINIIVNNENHLKENIIKENEQSLVNKGKDKSTNIKNRISDLFLLKNQVFIDNLDSQNENIKILTEDENEFTIINDNSIMNELIETVFEKIKSDFKNDKDFETINKIKNALKMNNNNVFDLIKNHLETLIDKKKILYDVMNNIKNNNSIKLYKEKQKENIINLLFNLINYLENDLSLSSTLFSTLSKNEI